MKTYIVTLCKGYLIKVKAKSAEDACQACELFTSDSQDLSTPEQRKEFGFEIEEMECTVNDVTGYYDAESFV